MKLPYFRHTHFALCAFIFITACGQGSVSETADETSPTEQTQPGEQIQGDESALQVGTTSVCITRPGGTTVRVDGAAIVSGTDSSSADSVVVQSAATETSVRGGAKVFIEKGGKYVNTGSGGNLVFVAAGGNANLTNGGGGQVIFAKAGSTVSCPAGSGANILNYEPGATLVGCSPRSGQLQVISKTTVETFRRCSSTTSVTAVYPKLKFTSTRSGSVVATTNQSTGTYTGPVWKVGAMKRPDYSYERSYTYSPTLFQSTTKSGFSWTVPTATQNQYPSWDAWSWSTTLQVTDPLGFPLGASVGLAAGASNPKNACIVRNITCPLHPAHTGYISDTNSGANTSAALCAPRAAANLKWCGATKPVRAVYFNSTGTIAGSTVALAPTRCEIKLTSCPLHPTAVGTFNDTYNGANLSVSACFVRPAQYISWCAAKVPVTATFYNQYGERWSSYTAYP